MWRGRGTPCIQINDGAVQIGRRWHILICVLAWLFVPIFLVCAYPEGILRVAKMSVVRRWEPVSMSERCTSATTSMAELRFLGLPPFIVGFDLWAQDTTPFVDVFSDVLHLNEGLFSDTARFDPSSDSFREWNTSFAAQTLLAARFFQEVTMVGTSLALRQDRWIILTFGPLGCASGPFLPWRRVWGWRWSR